MIAASSSSPSSFSSPSLPSLSGHVASAIVAGAQTPAAAVAGGGGGGTKIVTTPQQSAAVETIQAIFAEMDAEEEDKQAAAAMAVVECVAAATVHGGSHSKLLAPVACTPQTPFTTASGEATHNDENSSTADSINIPVSILWPSPPSPFSALRLKFTRAVP